MISENYYNLSRIKRLFTNLELLSLVLIVSSISWSLILFFNPYYFADLEKVYTDHMRHEYVSWLFLSVGFKIFNTPIRLLMSQVPSLNPHPTWDMHPSIYPLGMILYFLPFGVLSNLGIINDAIIHKLMVLSFLIEAHIALYYFIKEWKKLNFGLFLNLLINGFFYLHLVFWSLNGFYDVLAILLLILSIKYYKKGSILKSIIILTGSFLLHYRSLLYFPLWIILLIRLLSQYKNRLRRQFTNINALSISFLWFLLVSSLNFYTIYLSFIDSNWDIPVTWQPSIISAYEGRLDVQILFFIFSAIIFFLLISRKSYLTISTVLLFSVYLFLTPNWMGWHHLFFFPVLLIPSNKTSIEIASLWLIITIYFTTPIISPLWISHLIQKMF